MTEKNITIEVGDDCSHDNLMAWGNYTGMTVNVDDEFDKHSKVDGMFTYKKYRCLDCGKIITVLNAVVEKV